MLNKSLENRRDCRNGRKYLQFNIARQLRVADLDIYSDTAADHSRRYSLTYHFGSAVFSHLEVC